MAKCNFPLNLVFKQQIYEPMPSADCCNDVTSGKDCDVDFLSSPDK